MKHEEPGQTQAINPDDDFADVDMQAIYADFIDRYEYWDMVLRTLPSPQAKDEALKEKARVKAIIERICAPQIYKHL